MLTLYCSGSNAGSIHWLYGGVGRIGGLRLSLGRRSPNYTIAPPCSHHHHHHHHRHHHYHYYHPKHCHHHHHHHQGPKVTQLYHRPTIFCCLPHFSHQFVIIPHHLHSVQPTITHHPKDWNSSKPHLLFIYLFAQQVCQKSGPNIWQR